MIIRASSGQRGFDFQRVEKPPHHHVALLERALHHVGRAVGLAGQEVELRHTRSIQRATLDHGQILQAVTKPSVSRHQLVQLETRRGAESGAPLHLLKQLKRFRPPLLRDHEHREE